MMQSRFGRLDAIFSAAKTDIGKSLLMLMFVLLCASCGPIHLLGPTDNPNFRKKDWEEMSITYWVNTRTNRIEQKFTVTNAMIIAEVKSRLNIKKVSGLSIGAGNQLMLRERGGEMWQGSVVFEDCVYICKSSDRWYSYRVDLADCLLFNTLVNLCVTNELKFHKRVTPDCIILRSNLARDYPSVE